MFKGSGTMRLMNDKELLMKIWNVYDALNLLKELIDEHNKLKRDFMVKEISLVDMDFPLYAIAENKFETEGFIFEFNPNDKTMKAEKEGEIFNLVKEE